jgi:tripartite-type tricarboxylate transporter receptor subunit TctC
MRRAFLKQAAALSASIAVPSLASAQADWPTRPIKILVPYPPGGAVDPIARALGTRMGGFLGQPIVVENRPGASTAIAAGAVAKGEPDGYTILITSPITHVLHTMQQPRGYDSVKDFAPIAAVSRSDFSVAVHSSVPAKTLEEFIAWGKANPDKVSAGVSAIGGADHLVTELFKLATGVNVNVVSYKGSGPAVVDLLAGRIQMMIVAHSLVRQHIEAGKLRWLAYAVQPIDKPPTTTLVGAGMKEFEPFITMNIILASAATPAPVVEKLASAIQRSLDTTETRNAIQSANQVPFFMPPDKLREKLANDKALFADIVRKTGIKFE